ncbi:SNF2 family N-terminal domain-containing protein [Amylostereum chailletii]|nr:SNF2 family N-terminal domain-containing protein [Amylostereum chailletii]
MTDRRQCNICCQVCQTRAANPPTSEALAYSTRHLLPAGTVHVSILQDDIPCNHQHGHEEWHQFCGEVLIPRLANAPADEQLCRELDFLILHRFIMVHFHLAASRRTVYLRIFVIPHDLPNTQGKLQIRDEASVLKPARRYLKNILPQVIQHDGQWHANDEKDVSTSSYRFLKYGTDQRSLADIYADIPSPFIKSMPLDDNEPLTRGQRLVQVIAHSGEQIPGLESRLHQYQRQSVATMLHKETGSSRISDPLYIPMVGIDKTIFFLQPASMQVLKECPMVVPARGGILCEDMGTGKTIMILALILSTRYQLPTPEESFTDPRPVMTPISFSHFPQAEFAATRKRALNEHEVPHRSTFPSLVEFMLHYCRTSDLNYRDSERQQSLEDHRLTEPLRLNVPFYLHYDENSPPTMRRPRKPIASTPRVVYLTSATLVVVPPNLLSQWTTEIHKHCQPDLRFLVVKSQDKFPHAPMLATDYDVVLTTHARFAAEEGGFDAAALRTLTLCSCPGYNTTRVPNCTCSPRNVSPLAQIRWKRLVIDEGHVNGTGRTRISIIASKLNVERRWIVSGTPTRRLLGLKFGSQNDSSEDIPQELAYPDDRGELKENGTPSGDSTVGNNQEVIRRWTSQDRQDLHRLEAMVCRFLQDPRFSSQSSLFNVNVIRQLFGPNGPEPGAVQVLTQVMSAVMVRHRTKDIELDVILPPMTQEVVLLDLDPVALKSYNALQAVIAVNAIDSERKDKDYLFHPSNRASLMELVENISQLMFWRVDEHRYNLGALSHHIDDTIATAKERGRDASDMLLLHNAKKHIQIAVEDAAWNAIQIYFDLAMPFRVTNIPTSVFNAWDKLAIPAQLSPDTDMCDGIMFASHLNHLRDFVLGRPLCSTSSLVEEGRSQALADEEFILWQSSGKKGKKRQRGEKSRREVAKATETARKAEAPETVKEIQRELQVAQARKDRRVEDGLLDMPDFIAPGTSRQPLLSNSPLATTRVQYSSSSKLNFILSEVLRYGANEKFLIFSKSPLTLMHVSDGLSLLRVKHLQYTTAVKLKSREQFVMTFETSDTFRVLLMELKHGSHGLNLISASRVIFCEPIWQADTEAQAIKRAHRIGQKRPISVKALAIRGTHEEIMMSRRAEQKEDDANLPTDFTDDVRMRDFIANPKFMEQPAGSYTPIKLDVPLLDVPPDVPSPSSPMDPSLPLVQASDGLEDAHDIGVSSGTPSHRTIGHDHHPAEDEPEQRPAKRARLVTFADAA